MSQYLNYFCVIEQLTKNKIIEAQQTASGQQHSESVYYSTSFQRYGTNSLLVFPVTIINNNHLIRLHTLKLHARIFKFKIDDIIAQCSV